MDIDPPDRDLMSALCSGDDRALDLLMDRHGGKLFHYLVRLLQNESDAGELAQETFVRVYQHRDKFRGEASFATWLYAIATNLARDRMRRVMRHPHVSLDASAGEAGAGARDFLEAPDAVPGARLERDERIELVRRAIAALPEEFRTPLILAQYEEMSHAEIARILKCSAKAVENRIYRARQQLRKLLAGNLAAYE